MKYCKKTLSLVLSLLMLLSLLSAGWTASAESAYYLTAANDSAIRAKLPYGKGSVADYDGLPTLLDPVTFVNNPLLDVTGTGLTIDIYLKFSDIPTTDQYFLLADKGEKQYSLAMDAGSGYTDILFFVGNSLAVYSVPDLYTFYVQWQRLTATYDGSTMKIYWNGNLVTSEPASVSMSSSGRPLFINGEEENSFTIGRLNRLSIFDKAKTPQEITGYNDPSCVLWLTPTQDFVVLQDDTTEVDTAALESAITQAQSKQAGNYTADSYQVLSNALTSALAVLANAGKTQAQVDAARQALLGAIAQLVPLGDNTALLALLAQARGIDSNDYTAASYALLTAAIASADAEASNPNRTASSLGAQLSLLRQAIDGLVPKADRTGLEKAIADAEKISNANADYTADSYQALQSALQMAKSLPSDSTPQQVEQAENTLNQTMENLVSLIPLKDAIASAKEKDASDYTLLSYGTLLAAVSQGENLLAQPAATVAEVEQGMSDIENAITQLVPVAGLKEKIAQAEAIGNAEAYTAASYRRLLQAKEAAQQILLSTESTHQDVEDAGVALDNALAGLVEISGLQQSLLQANDIQDASLYTTESFLIFRNARDAAAAVLAQDNPTQTLVNQTKAALDAAIAGLVPYNPPEEGRILAPESALVEESFVITAYLPSNISAVQLINHNGSKIGLLVVEKTAGEGQNIWRLSLKVGTAGLGRIFTLLGKQAGGQYEDTGLSFTIDILLPENPAAETANLRSVVFSHTTAKVNESIPFTVVTDSKANKIHVYNEKDARIGVKVVSRTVETGKITWVCELAVGTAGARALAVAAANKYDVPNLKKPYIATLTIQK